LQILDKQEGLRQYAGPGHWNDPDMLEVGNGGLLLNENRAHFTMWAMLAAPLIAGNDLRTMSKETRDVLTNKEVIALNQDSLGIQGLRYRVADSVETWVKPLRNGDWAFCFLNRSVTPKPVRFNWAAEVIADTVAKRTFSTASGNYIFRDLWTGKELGNTSKPLATTVPAHDVLVVRLRKSL
jgi:alpha-galactosidase